MVYISTFGEFLLIGVGPVPVLQILICTRLLKYYVAEPFLGQSGQPEGGDSRLLVCSLSTKCEPGVRESLLCVPCAFCCKHYLYCIINI
jgi:hypothetical protein